ncbi:RHS repeat domain-containing protein [Ferruginibacter sp. HRS2-29]|uniref:RHS repeat domain-containing protein n=1 Tax=Ferruginibacter sp. HRS2-29 TaxID=2487334 RepID=UPI0020CCB1C1|nr:hypothetical protein [Ferruginibacter sp. HRS2-29]MCP9752451.1 hypothetical protein [Ferruginibacter sp. HRS2-29]
MRYFKSNIAVSLAWVIFLIFSAAPAKAIDVSVKSLPLFGKDSTLKATATMSVFDSVLVGSSGWNVRNVKNLVTFKIDEYSNRTLPDSFKVSVIYQIDYKVWPTTSVLTRTDTLILTYNKNNPYTNKVVIVYPGVYSSTLTITSVNALYGSIPLASFEKSIMMESEIQSSRDFTAFDCNTHAVKAISKNSDYVATDGELQVSWASVLQADEYDVEWAVIDDAALPQYYATGTTTPDPLKIFDDNATRVSLPVDKVSYRIPLLYEKGTILFVRVRSVQILAGNQRREANWSSAYSGGMERYDITGGLAPTMDWQATTSYAEEGKRKSVVQFYDGTLRSRQTVTKDNVKNTTVVAETYYDMQGRPQIQVLPSPTISSLIKFTPNFNVKTTGDEYTKDSYDKLLADYCNTGADKMGTASGAGKYYSPSSPDADKGANKFIPDAKGYPFTETKYTQDATGRISEQGGVGAYHQLGLGISGDASSQLHQTKYYYGSAEQEDLDALFGTEVGNVSHYSKNMVRDANGQLSISYVDMHGRTIATSLAGTPLNTSLVNLNSNTSTFQTRNLLGGGSNIQSDKYTVQSMKSLLITKDGSHHFSYSLAGDSLQLKDCDSTTICYDCQYDLEITITDDCNNSNMPGGVPYVAKVSNFTLADFLAHPDTTCNTPSGIIWSADVSLPVGSYMITKKLSVNRQAFAAYRDSIFLPHNTCKTLQQFIDSVRAAVLSNISCETTCQACTDSIGTWESYRSKFMTKLNIAAADSAGYRQAAYNSYLLEKSACEEICVGTTTENETLSLLLEDVSAPAGQYANDASTAIGSRYAWSMFSPDFAAGPKLKYQVPATAYVDADGNPSVVNGQSPENLTPQEFSENFQDSWAKSLLPKHPEYPRYLRMTKFKNSFAWDKDFENTTTYAAAYAKGYLNPTGKATAPFINFSPVVTGYIDPFYKICLDSFSIANKVVTMENFMQDISLGTVTGGISIWNMATISVKCGDDDPACSATYSSLANAFSNTMCTADLDAAWVAFRDQYLNYKSSLLYEIVTLNAGIYPAIPLNSGDVDHALRILSPADKAAAIALGNGASTPSGYINEANTLIDDQIAQACEGYADQWMTELGTCNYTEPQKAALKIELIKVCKAGGDVDHPMGASTVRPGSTVTPKSFEEVIVAFNLANGITTNINCNADLISAPLPYEAQLILTGGDEVVTGRPDSCTCTKISEYYSKYIQQPNGATSFSAYLNQQLHVSLADSTLDQLMQLCNPLSSTDCNTVTTPITIPLALQCVKDPCISCTQMKQYYREFRYKYPGSIVNLADSISDTQIAVNKLFQNYMNHITGFNKTAREYLLFMNECGLSTDDEIPVSTITCAQLQEASQNYPGYVNPTVVDGDGVPVGLWSLTTSNNPRDISGYKFKDFIRDGMFSTPDSVTLYPGDFALFSEQQLCTGPEFSTEVRVRTKPGFDPLAAQWLFGFQFAGGSRIFQAIFTANNGSVCGARTVTPSEGLLDDLNHPELLWPMQNWTTVKIVFKNQRGYIYINGVLKYSRAFNYTITSLDHLSLGGRADTPMEYDYVRFYDAYGNLMWNENFDGPTKLARPSYKWKCDKPACDTSFTTYFNNLFSTSYTYTQILQLYSACGIDGSPCNALPSCQQLKNTLVGYTQSINAPTLVDGYDVTSWSKGIGYVPRDLSGYHIKDFLVDGMLTTPDSVTVFPGDFSFMNWRTMCTGKEFSFETEMRVKPGIDPVPTQVGIQFWPLHTNGAESAQIVIFTGNSNWTGIQGSMVDTNGVVVSNWELNKTSMHTVFDTFKVVRVTFKNDRLWVYVDGVLKADFYYPGKYIAGLKFFSVFSWYDKVMQYKYMKFYDKYGTLVFNEEFNDPSNFEKVPYQWVCSKPDCSTTFPAYFNAQYGTSYTYEQIADLYKRVCGEDLGLCPQTPGPKLCATPDSLPAFNPPSKCDLAINGATALATDLYNAYRDSLVSSFEDRYLKKCTNVFNRETFTVTDSTSEYHYTLYYYDQAGNLVKTVPPEGVNLRKMDHKITWSDSVKTARSAGTALLIQHGLPTRYRYNTLNQVVSQSTPDAGASNFWYDRLGRLVVSQNARQKNINPSGEENRRFSYTLYDYIGRINEVGEYVNVTSTGMSQSLSRNATSLGSWLGTSYLKREVVTTTYDVPNPAWYGISSSDVPVNAANLRNRVAFTQYYPDGSPNGATYRQATYYSYDIHGNVDTLIQDYGTAIYGAPFINMMNYNGIHNRFKKMVYQYDLISGKVNHVAYQPQFIKNGYLYRPADAMYHKYEYDAENRITAVHTSIDSLIWEKDAAYDYYKHGPLARTILGEQQVQGVDYAYTIQGWLKGVNSSSLAADKDMGLDGLTTNASSRYVAKDAYGFSLNYFDGDYQSIYSGAGTTSMPLHSMASGITNGLPNAAYRPLYNGNISSMVVNIGALSIPDVSGTGTTNGAILYNYTYDQLNRLKAMDAFKGLTAANNSWSNIIGLRNYRERIGYDGNGNILTYSRYGNNNSQQLMDSLSYSYNYEASGPLAGKLSNNRLRRVRDFMTNTSAYDESDIATGVSDLEDQSNADNYTYDAIGNLKSDAKENITLINWNVYGKITDINFGFVANKNKAIYYQYDAAGNRISKQVEKYGATSDATTTSTYTWYTRDASGNVMAVYNSSATGTAFPATLALGERHLYGSSRLGILSLTADSKTLPFNAAGTIYGSNFIRGNKFFELGNHLGNVLVTISDKKFGVDDGTYDPATGVKTNSTPDSKIDFYTADVVTANDYYPFGMLMPGRKFAENSKYRYGFNGKENDSDIKGDGNAYNFGARIQDSRLGGRFFSTDPMATINPGESTYTFAGDNPIAFTDFNGLFKISPYFANKYPTLAKIIEHVLPTYINNTSARDYWIYKMGFDDHQSGVSAWEEMLTYGKGPWVTPTMTEDELTKSGGSVGKDLYRGRFGNGSGNEWSRSDGFPNNISFESYNLINLELALKAGNDEEVAFNMFRSMILIMHESGHWARSMKAHKDNITGGRAEDGAKAEYAVFGIQFSYTNNVKDGENRDAMRDDLIRPTSNGARALWKFTTGKTVTESLKKLPNTAGQEGDPVLKAAQIKEGKVFVPSSTKTTGSGKSSGSSGNKNRNYSY